MWRNFEYILKSTVCKQFLNFSWFCEHPPEFCPIDGDDQRQVRLLLWHHRRLFLSRLHRRRPQAIDLQRTKNTLPIETHC
jgi:hypothetical protein